MKKFLTLRAKAFRTDDYFESELAWMDLKDTPIEVAIGPYEVYTDGLYGRKTAFEAFVTLRNPTESAALDKYKAELRGMEENLPVEASIRISSAGSNRRSRSPTRSMAAATMSRGPDDRLQPAQRRAGARGQGRQEGHPRQCARRQIRPHLEADGEPGAGPRPGGAGDQEIYDLETLFHELSHSLGPGSIIVGGRKTTVDKELKDLAGGFEEAKADVMGAWNILYMMEKGVLPAAERPQIHATYVAGLFRAMRFGVDEAHGKGAAMQYRYLREKGALVWDAQAKRFRIDEAKIDGAIRDLVAEIVRRQGDGDYAGTKAFLDKYGHTDPEADQVIATMTHIPVDIRPVYPERI